ncbi:MAG: PKD domain-containing protein [Bacteroidetes bacterium]|nr:PKD domain-containing protein [Bacteroidota bacterium]
MSLVIGMMVCQVGTSLFSQTTASHGNRKFLTRPFENKVFIEERGQFKKSLEDKKISLAAPILYAVTNPEFKAYFTSTGITFLFSETEKINEEKEEGDDHEKDPFTKWVVVNIKWLNTAASMQVSAKEKVNNYYTYGKFNDNSQYDHVSAYKKLSYVNIYEGVDAEFELPETGGIKYQFIVHAGFKIPAIAYQTEGTKDLYLDNKGDLHIVTMFGKLIDKAPIVLGKSTEIPINYILTGNKVEIGFKNTTLSLSEDLVIDPWIINPALPAANIACDIQEDSLGNVFVNGGTTGSGSYQVQKYNSTGVLQWSHDYSCTYYGDIAVSNSGSTYFTDGITGKVSKLTPAGAVIFSITEGAENWRLSFNRSKTILAMGGNFGSSSLTNIDTTNGAFTNTVSYPSDTWAIATDCNGDIYSLHHGASPCILRKTNANFTPATSLVTTPDFCISGYNNVRSYASGYNAITISGPYLYVYDGLNLRRFLKNTLTFVNSVPVANGAANNCSGVAFDYCGNIYVGTMSTIEKYDMSLNYLYSIPAPNIVYDIILASNGDLLACGKSFVTNLGPTCPAPPQLTSTSASTNASCKLGTATIYPVGGSTPYTYLWQPGGQTMAAITGLTSGTYTYTVNDAFCQSKQDSVVVVQTLPLSLTQGAIVKESCLNSFNGSAMVHASGGTEPYSYSWNTNPIQNSQLATGLSAGTYIATVVDIDSCLDTLSVIITRNPDPVAKFGNTTVCNNTATQFTDSSSTSAGTISSRSWNFGDASPLNTAQNPSHLYANAGNYNVTLIVHNNFGCGDTITKSVQVYYNPVAAFTYSNVCLGDTMYFTNTSTVHNSTSITGYLWAFGDGSPNSNSINPAHYYSNQGTYSVTLVTTTANVCTDAETYSVKAFDAPVSAFTFSDICLLDSAVFTNTTLSPTMGSTASWSWDFGDGSLLNTNLWSPHHLYATPGTYQVTLTTYSSNLACPDTLSDSITVFPMPVANFSFTNVCLNEVMNFNDLSTVTSGTIANRSWNFGDGTSPNGNPNPSHIYTNPGSYTVTLIVTTNNSCKDTITKSVAVHPLPLVQFSSVNVCKGSSISFTDLSSILSTDNIQSWAWNFGDGSPVLNNQNTSHVYANAGSYAVQLLIASNFGCIDSITKTSIVNPNPQVDFTSNDTAGCERLCIRFIDSSSVATGSNINWIWNVGDGSPVSNLIDPVHCYINDSVYSPVSFNVALTVTSDSGCVTTLSKTNYITVYPNPNADFTVQPEVTTITDPIISITDLSTGAYYWNWNFGDGDTSSAFKPAPHAYQDTSTYTITLITSTQYNCIDTAYQTIIIEPDFMFYIPNAFSPNDDGINDFFSGKGTFVGIYEMTIFDRWGNLIFSSDDITKPWDGKANRGTVMAQADVYIYSIKITDFKKRKHIYKGIVTLMR